MDNNEQKFRRNLCSCGWNDNFLHPWGIGVGVFYNQEPNQFIDSEVKLFEEKILSL